MDRHHEPQKWQRWYRREFPTTGGKASLIRTRSAAPYRSSTSIRLSSPRSATAAGRPVLAASRLGWRTLHVLVWMVVNDSHELVVNVANRNNQHRILVQRKSDKTWHVLSAPGEFSMVRGFGGFLGITEVQPSNAKNPRSGWQRGVAQEQERVWPECCGGLPRVPAYRSGCDRVSSCTSCCDDRRIAWPFVRLRCRGRQHVSAHNKSSGQRNPLGRPRIGVLPCQRSSLLGGNQ